MKNNIHRVRWLRLMGLVETIEFESPWTIICHIRKIVRIKNASN